MTRRLLPLALCLLLLGGCAPAAVGTAGPRRFEATFLELFDTVTTVVGYADAEADFRREVEDLRRELLVYHQLYDIYNDYEGINNLKTVNDSAGVRPVVVDEKILDLLAFCQEMYTASGGKVNAAMGSVLGLWHDAREAAVADPESAHLPEAAGLEEAMAHISFDQVVLDREASTVYLADPQQRLDVGAVAKGYALEQVCRNRTLPMIVSLGGNVQVVGAKPDGSDWVVGVQDPDGGEEFLRTLALSSGAVVTSGDYQRYFTVDGVRYHHIIDPDTAYPADRYRAVTVLCPDGGVGDALSTALFTMDEAAGKALLSTYGAEALWVLPDGTIHCTDGFQDAIRT